MTCTKSKGHVRFGYFNGYLLVVLIVSHAHMFSNTEMTSCLWRRMFVIHEESWVFHSKIMVWLQIFFRGFGKEVGTRVRKGDCYGANAMLS